MTLDINELMREIRDDVKAMRMDMAEMKTSQMVMEKDVEHHIRRSEMLEARVDLLEKKVLMWAGGLAVAGWAVATVITVLKLFL